MIFDLSKFGKICVRPNPKRERWDRRSWNVIKWVLVWDILGSTHPLTLNLRKTRLMTCLTSKVHWWRRRQTRSKCQSLRHLLSSHHAHQRRSTAALFIIQFVIFCEGTIKHYCFIIFEQTRHGIFSTYTFDFRGFHLTSEARLGNEQKECAILLYKNQ